MRFSTNFQRKTITGISPEHPKTQVSAEPNEALSTGSERLTVESACDHGELLEVRQSTPFRRNSTSEFVGVSPVGAKIEYLE